MKCPLLRLAEVVSGRYDLDDKGVCLKEECAWWVLSTEECSIRDIAHLLAATNKALSSIAKELKLLRPPRR